MVIQRMMSPMAPGFMPGAMPVVLEVRKGLTSPSLIRLAAAPGCFAFVTIVTCPGMYVWRRKPAASGAVNPVSRPAYSRPVRNNNHGVLKRPGWVPRPGLS